MKKNKSSKQFFFGKNLPKSDSQRSPVKGEPNSNIDFYNKKDGSFHRRRKIGSSGIAIKDLDNKDGHKDRFHVHDYIGYDRQEQREPSKQEAREFNKAKRKRRFWK